MSSPQLVLYGAAGCHLCEAAEEVLQEVAARCGIGWLKVSIDGDAALEAAYRSEIPVVTLDGRKIAKFRIGAAELEAALRARGVGPH